MKPDLWFAIPGDIATLTGGYTYDRRLMQELRGQGLDVRHLALAGDWPFAGQDDLDAADVALAALPDGATVLVDGLAYGVLAAPAVKQRDRLRLIALCHHPLALETGLDAAQAASLAQSERTALGAARAVVVTSSGTAALLCDHYGVPHERIVVACPGCDRRPFADCDGTPPVLLTVATLIRRKAHDVLIAALATLRDLPWQARFVGGEHFDTAWSRKLRADVAAAGLDDRITFVGEQPHLADEYRRADLFVLPSLFEGYGMVFSEAIAAGLPVVAARAGAVPEVVPDEAGMLVPPGDSGALAEALRLLLCNPEERRRLQQGARTAATTLPRWEDTAARVATLVKEIDA